MVRTLAMAVMAVLLVAVPATAQFRTIPAETVASGTVGTCGAPAFDPDTARWIEGLLSSRPRAEMRAPGSVEIPVAFHVVHAGRKGRVSDEQIRVQIENLNTAFRDTPFRFRLVKVDRTNNKSWYNNCAALSRNEKNMKRRLSFDPRDTMNIYSCKTSGYPEKRGVIGYAYFPFMYPETSYMHGPVVHTATLPGSGDAEFGIYGMTLIHEVGHYLGLYHTFQGGCQGEGDFVADTPAQATPTGPCSERNVDSCPAPGRDDVPNFMNYTGDECMEHFSPLQAERMVNISSTFRPRLFN